LAIWRASVENTPKNPRKSKEMLTFAQQDWIDKQQDLISKPVFEQYRCQRRTAPAVLSPGFSHHRADHRWHPVDLVRLVRTFLQRTIPVSTQPPPKNAETSGSTGGRPLVRIVRLVRVFSGDPYRAYRAYRAYFLDKPSMPDPRRFPPRIGQQQ
jgi:hypothetical protein